MAFAQKQISQGLIDEGTLLWTAHPDNGSSAGAASMRTLPRLVRAAAGPEVIDLESRIYWTC
jgi:hypothetical protein